MKNIFCVMALILSGCAMSLVQFTEDENLVEVFEDLPGSKEQLYTKANSWMIEAFNNAESVVQHSDKEEGVIIGKYLMYGGVSAGIYGVTNDTRVWAIIDIRLKDNKARVEIKPQGSWRYDGSGMTIYNFSKEDAINEMIRLTESLYASLTKDDVQF